MNVRVDFLPETYRERERKRRRRVQRLTLAIPVLIALCVTDVGLSRRADIAAAMAANAQAHADQSEQRVMQVRQLAARLVAQHEQLERTLLPLQAPRMIQTLDAIVASQPADVALLDLNCSLTPWATVPTSSVRLTASCATPELFETFLASLRTEAILPELRCARTFQTQDGLGFHLDSSAEKAAPR